MTPRSVFKMNLSKCAKARGYDSNLLSVTHEGPVTILPLIHLKDALFQIHLQ